MKEIYQTTRANCFQACVAFVLQIPLEEAFNHEPYADDEWFIEFNRWLQQYGLGCIFIESNPDKPLVTTSLVGIHIAECMSEDLYNGVRHAVVFRNHYELFHDPLPGAKRQGELRGIYIFVPLEPYLSVRQRR